MKDIEINGKKYNIPQSLHEMSLKEYCHIFKGIKFTDKMEWKDMKYAESKLISRIMGEDDEFALSLPLSIYNTLCEVCSFLYDVNKIPHTAKIKLGDKYYTIPNPNEMSLRQWIDIDLTRQTESEDMFIELFSILLCEVGEDGKVMEYKADYANRIKLLEEYPADEAMSMINDFFVYGKSSQAVTDAYSKAEEAIDRFLQHTENS